MNNVSTVFSQTHVIFTDRPDTQIHGNLLFHLHIRRDVEAHDDGQIDPRCLSEQCEFAQMTNRGGQPVLSRVVS
jgi:hypothetical protein